MAKKDNVLGIMKDYSGMGCKVDLLGRVSVHKNSKANG